MGYGYYLVSDYTYGGTRPGGYYVLATCDRRGCENEIDRGLGFLCGSQPHGPLDAADGCGRYHCSDHDSYVGPRGGCSHRGKKAWGRTLSCMKPNENGFIVCTTRAGHSEPHGWEPGGSE